MSQKTILVVGGGAREHALVWKLRASPQVGRVLCAPGNAGIAEIAETFNVGIEDINGLVLLAKREGVELVIVGPEAPLVLGLVDALEAVGIHAFGPNKAAAVLEGSKAFAKEIMHAAHVPTAASCVFVIADEAMAYVRQAGRPLVVKADGLCAGKGVVVAKDADEACEAIHDFMVKRIHGEAGARVVIEETLVGPEISYHVLCDGTHIVPLASAQDHKRLLDGDRGPNTGGMGAYSPAPMLTPAMEKDIDARVVLPVLMEMQKRGTPFRGVLFVGLMIVDGAPSVLEFNVRFGDPETTVLMARLEGDLFPLLDGSARGAWCVNSAPSWKQSALTVVLAAAGYPASPRKGDAITGLTSASGDAHTQVFHAGTKRDGLNVMTNGGRVLAVTATGDSIDEAATRAYARASKIQFDGMQLRSDIGWQARL